MKKNITNKLKDRLIKLLGGYTEKEMTRSKRKYQALLDSQSKDKVAIIVNEHIYRCFRDLRRAVKELYGDGKWDRKVWNLINNNFFRLMCRYVHVGSTSFYVFDATLDGDHEFMNIMKEENNFDEIEFILEND